MMTGEDMMRWRKTLKIKRSEASRILGMSPHTIKNYEECGVKVPLYVALACAAILYNVPPYGATITKENLQDA